MHGDASALPFPAFTTEVCSKETTDESGRVAPLFNPMRVESGQGTTAAHRSVCV